MLDVLSTETFNGLIDKEFTLTPQGSDTGVKLTLAEVEEKGVSLLGANRQ